MMRWFCMVMLSGGAGLWLSSQYQFPQWLLWPLLMLGTATWGFAKWMEWADSKKGRHDGAC
jgi:hypothetical protein